MASMNTYPHRAMLATLLSYGDDAKKTQLTSELFYADEAGKVDTVPFGGDAAARNSGLMKRATFTATSNVVDMIGRIHADIFFQDRYLINEVNVKIKLVRSKDAFSIMTANDRRKVRAVRGSTLQRLCMSQNYGRRQPDFSHEQHGLYDDRLVIVGGHDRERIFASHEFDFHVHFV